jgi:guanidinoacetate N-methyltransferase
MGISATAIQPVGVVRHVIVEANPQVIEEFERWRDRHASGVVELVLGRWQDVEAELGRFYGIFFDTYALDEVKWHHHVRQEATCAEHFFETAARHLTADEAFTYFTSEIDTIGRPHQGACQEFRRIQRASNGRPAAPARLQLLAGPQHGLNCGATAP